MVMEASLEEGLKEWQEWKAKYGKEYPSPDEEATGRENFDSNLNFVTFYNFHYAKDDNRMTLNEMADRTQAEIVILHDPADLRIPTDWPDAQFEMWQIRFNRTYPNAAEKARRYVIFCETRARVHKHNENPARTFDMALTNLADMTEEELQKRLMPRRSISTLPPVKKLMPRGASLPNMKVSSPHQITGKPKATEN